MGEKLVQAGTVFSAFTAVALVVFGGFRVRYGVWSVEEALVLLFLAVAVVASYRSVAVHSGPRVNAVGTIALFTIAVAYFFISHY